MVGPESAAALLQHGRHRTARAVMRCQSRGGWAQHSLRAQSKSHPDRDSDFDLHTKQPCGKQPKDEPGMRGRPVPDKPSCTHRGS